jgi:hypothetical protein
MTRIVNFSIKDRLFLENFMPEKGSMITLKARKDLLEKIEITQKEMTEINFQEVRPGSGAYKWDKEPEVGIEITDFELNLLKNGAKHLNDTESIPFQCVELYEKIIAL